MKSFVVCAGRYLSALVIVLFAGSGHAAELMSNPGFEFGGALPPGAAANRCGGSVPNITGTVASGWLDNSCRAGANTSITYSMDSSGQHGGSTSQKIVLAAGTAQMVGTPASGAANTAYNFSIWLRSNSAAMPISVSLTQIAAPYTTYGGQTVNVGTTWTRYNFVMPKPTQSAWIVVQASTPGTFWVDDASLQANPELLANTGFEGAAQGDASACGTIGGASTTSSISVGIASGWSCWASSPAIQATLSLDTGRLGTGSSQKINIGNPNGGYLLLQQYGFPAQAWTPYAASVWMKSSNAAGLPVEIGLNTGDGQTDFASIRVNVPNTWTQFILNGQVDVLPSGTRLFVRPAQAGTVWVDDASLSGQTLGASTPPTTKIPNSYFGLHINHLATAAPHSSQNVRVPYGARRLWDTAAWMSVNPSKGVYDWTTLDTIVADAAALGYDLVMDIGSPPQWASARPNEGSPYGYNGSSAEPLGAPNDMTIWTNWITTVATRYNGKIKYWEIWNEPAFPTDPGTFFTGSPETLLALQRSAYSTLKSINSGNVVLTPAFTTLDYMSYYASIGGTASADILAFHQYTAGGPEPLRKFIAPNVRLVENAYANPLPIWNTEFGWLSPLLSADVQAGYLARAYLLNWAAGVPRAYFYSWDASGLGVMPLNGDQSVAPAGDAYYWIQQWLTGKVMSGGLIPDAGGNWVATLTASDGTVSHVVWNPGSTASYVLPTGWPAQHVQTLSGAISATMPGATINIGPKPVRVY